MFKVVLTARAVRDFEKLDAEIRHRIATKLKAYAANPIANARKLSNPKIPLA